MASQNCPPLEGIRVPHVVMSGFIARLFSRVGAPASDARHLGEILTANDLRCVFSHGTRQACAYVRQMRDGHTNPEPRVTVHSETAATAVLDGDGGLGYFPAHRGMELAIQKALEVGVATITTRNHFHFGAAGNYSRMALPHDCIGLALSSHRYRPNPERSVMSASGGSPMSIAVPAGEQPPLVLDMSTHFLPQTDELISQFPAVFFKSLGLAAVLQALGGILAGIWNGGYAFSGEAEGAAPHQGSFIAAFDVRRFADPREFKKEMDRYIERSRSTRPLPGQGHAELAGGMEWIWERENRLEGVPISPGHEAALTQVAREIDVETPFTGYAHTRFGRNP